MRSSQPKDERTRRSRPRRLLFITGNRESRIGFTRVARRWHAIRLLVAEGGRVGLEMALKQQPDLVVLDAHLPDMTSVSLIRNLHAAPDRQSVPIVVIGVDATGSEKDRFLQEGAFCYLTRPLNIEEVERRVLGLIELAILR